MGVADMISPDGMVLGCGRRVGRGVEYILAGGGVLALGRGNLQQAVCRVLQRYHAKLPATGTNNIQQQVRTILQRQSKQSNTVIRRYE